MKRIIFLKNTQCQISLTATGNNKISKRTGFGSITANDHRLCFQKMCSVFHLFQVEWKSKSFKDLWDFSTFSIIFTDDGRGTQALQRNVWRNRELSHNSVYLFRVENVFMEKVKTSNISDTMQQISSIFHYMFAQIMGY